MKHNIIETINSIINILKEDKGAILKSVDSCDEHTFPPDIEEPLNILSNYFRVNKVSAIMASVIFFLNYDKDAKVGLKEIADFFHVTPLSLLKFSKTFDILEQRKIIKKENSPFRENLALANVDYIIHEEITTFIINNKAVPKSFTKADVRKQNIYGLATEMSIIAERMATVGTKFCDVNKEILKILKNAKDQPFYLPLEQLHLPPIEQFIVLYLLDLLVNNEDSLTVGELSALLYEDKEEDIAFQKQLLSERKAIFQQNLVYFEKQEFANQNLLHLSDFAKSALLGEDARLFIKHKNSNIIPNETIKPKTLYYSPTEEEQVGFLERSLSEEHFHTLKDKLSEKGYAPGITAIFYGEPGTGKTETVYQLALHTQRNIVHVDISKIKSCWFGESEKLIKNIFENYKSILRNCDRVPILLFNEADAILGKRKDDMSGNLSQTENAIQNILLEEIERCEGILIATTNLHQNLDAAFERRFLFKVKFEKPTLENRIKIWQNKLPELPLSEVSELAALYDFSGGQIDNIVRKYEISKILETKRENVITVSKFCKEERFAARKIPIGYNVKKE